MNDGPNGYDNDGDQDLFVSRLGQPNSLYRNNGKSQNWSFTDIGRKAGIEEPKNSFPAWFFDYNNDGWPDIVVADMAPEDNYRSKANMSGMNPEKFWGTGQRWLSLPVYV